jgi:hypothetical protein
MEDTGINAIECPAAEQLEDVLAHLKQAHFLISIHALRIRTAEYERQKKAKQRAGKRAPTERPDAGTSGRIAS